MLLLVGSLAGVLALAVIAWWLGLGRTEPLTEQEVRSQAEFELMPFSVLATFLSMDGNAALAIGGDGRVLAIKKHGTQPASRTLIRPEWRQEGDAVVVETGDRRFGRIRLALDAGERDKLLTLL